MKYLLVKTVEGKEELSIVENPVEMFSNGSLPKSGYKLYQIGQEVYIKISLESYKVTRSTNPHDDR